MDFKELETNSQWNLGQIIDYYQFICLIFLQNSISVIRNTKNGCIVLMHPFLNAFNLIYYLNEKLSFNPEAEFGPTIKSNFPGS